MLRKFLCLSVLIVLFTTAAFADVGHIQGFTIGAHNIVNRCGPIGSAFGENKVMVGQCQQVYKPRFSTATQSQGGLLVQRGSAYGNGGMSGVGNHASVRALQSQHAKPYGSSVQTQQLKANLGQMAVKHYGVGGTQGVQSFVGGQKQTISAPGLTSMQSQNVGIQQSAVITGCNGSNATVVNKANVNMSQGQNTTTAPIYPHYKK
jgi:hypothetical protein